MNIYIACALTHVPSSHFDEHVAFIHALADALREGDPGAQVKYALVNSDPQLATRPTGDRARLCYLWDRTMVEEIADPLVHMVRNALDHGLENEADRKAKGKTPVRPRMHLKISNRRMQISRARMKTERRRARAISNKRISNRPRLTPCSRL